MRPSGGSGRPGGSGVRVAVTPIMARLAAVLSALAGLVLLAGGGSRVEVCSRRCAPCHGAQPASGAPDLFREWRESPYSDDLGGRACTDCHHPDGLPESCRGGVASGCGDEPALPPLEPAALQLSAGWGAESILADAAVYNSGTGHGFPASPRSGVVRLELTARDADGQLVETVDPPGASPAGSPDRLRDRRAWSIVLGRPSSTRLQPFGTVVLRAAFRPCSGPVTVEARVLRSRQGRAGLPAGETLIAFRVVHLAGVEPGPADRLATAGGRATLPAGDAWLSFFSVT